MFEVGVHESDSCAVCRKTGSAENPMVVLSDRRKRREESSYISFHVKDCWDKAATKANRAIQEDRASQSAAKA